MKVNASNRGCDPHEDRGRQIAQQLRVAGVSPRAAPRKHKPQQVATRWVGISGEATLSLYKREVSAEPLAIKARFRYRVLGAPRPLIGRGRHRLAQISRVMIH